MSLCSIADCPKPAKTRGLCGMHYARLLRHGDPLYEPPARVPQVCSVDSCDKAVTKRGLCNGHYIRQRRGVDSDAPVADRGGPQRQSRGTCVIDGCERTVWNLSRGLCRRHYHLQQKYGDPTTRTKLVNPTWPEIAALTQRNPETGCLEWQGAKDANGYGVVSFEGRKWLTHRLFWSQEVAPLTEGLTVDHLCFVRHCVEIEHLEEVTQSVNTGRALVRRWADPKPLCDKHDPSETLIVNEGAKRRRRCRACAREAARERYRRRREQV